MSTTAADLGRALAAWLHRNTDPEDLDAYHRAQRSVKWRVEPDGMVHATTPAQPCRHPHHLALTTFVMRTRAKPEPDGDWPTAAQQHADGVEDLLTNGIGTVDTEVVLHVRGDGNSLDDGTPISDSIVAELIPQAFISALIHDSNGDSIDATNRRRHPNRRQKRLVKERDKTCVDCGRGELLQYDHVPDYEQTGHTVTGELRVRCASCHHRRHRNQP